MNLRQYAKHVREDCGGHVLSWVFSYIVMGEQLTGQDKRRQVPIINPGGTALGLVGGGGAGGGAAGRACLTEVTTPLVSGHGSSEFHGGALDLASRLGRVPPWNWADL